LFTCFVCLVLVALFASPVRSQDESPSLVDEIVRMLKAELSERIVLDWLEASGRQPTSLLPDELIALKVAGATDELLEHLIAASKREELSESEAPSTPTESVAAASPETPESERSPESSENPESAVDALPEVQRIARPVIPSPERAAPADAAEEFAEIDDVDPTDGSGVLTRFRLSYSPLTDDGDDAWGLYVYLDGIPLSFVPESRVQSVLADAADGIEFTQRLPVGEHRLQLLLERHEKRRRAWEHSSRAAPEGLDFELLPGAAAEVDVTFRQSTLQSVDPISVVVRQEERVFEQTEVGGEPDQWPSLCDDLQGSSDVNRGHDPSLERQLRKCVGWDSLWEVDGPSRSDILKAMEQFDFRPIPNGA